MAADPLARKKTISETLAPLVTARLQLRLLTLADAAAIRDVYSVRHRGTPSRFFCQP